MSLHVAYTSLRVAYTGLRVAYTSLHVAYTGLRVANTGLHVAYTGLRVAYTSLRKAHLGKLGAISKNIGDASDGPEAGASALGALFTFLLFYLFTFHKSLFTFTCRGSPRGGT